MSIRRQGMLAVAFWDAGRVSQFRNAEHGLPGSIGESWESRQAGAMDGL